MYEVFGDTAVRVLLSLDSGDSIRSVAQRIETPYETVRQAVNELESAGFIEYDNGLYRTGEDVRERARSLMAATAQTSPPSIDEAYTIPHFGDWPFAFTRIDAVYVWTQGGFQIGRSPDDYPLFLAVDQDDVDEWDAFFTEFGLPVSTERQPADKVTTSLQFVLEPRDQLDVETVEGYPVIPREETIDYMQENYAAFASGLDVLNRMYDDLSLDVNYRENDRDISP